MLVRFVNGTMSTFESRMIRIPWNACERKGWADHNYTVHNVKIVCSETDKDRQSDRFMQDLPWFEHSLRLMQAALCTH